MGPATVFLLSLLIAHQCLPLPCHQRLENTDTIMILLAGIKFRSFYQTNRLTVLCVLFSLFRIQYKKNQHSAKHACKKREQNRHRRKDMHRTLHCLLSKPLVNSSNSWPSLKEVVRFLKELRVLMMYTSPTCSITFLCFSLKAILRKVMPIPAGRGRVNTRQKDKSHSFLLFMQTDKS